jgi:hypothetical protein
MYPPNPVPTFRVPSSPVPSQPIYQAKACLTPVGPCIEAKGPHPLEVAAMVAGGVVTLYAGYRIVQGIAKALR